MTRPTLAIRPPMLRLAMSGLASQTQFAFVLFFLLLTPQVLLAQGGTPLGPEFRVNTYTTDYQAGGAIALDAAGNFVVVWESRYQYSNTISVFGQRYAASGVPLGPEFRVNTFETLSISRIPMVTSDPSGNFIVAWQGNDSLGALSAINARRFANTGAPQGAEFRVSSFTLGYQYRPSLAADAVGNFVVTWHSSPQDGGYDGVVARRFASSGIPLRDEFQVNTYTTNYQGRAAVASDSSGNFVIVWESYAQDGDGMGIFAQRYASTGTRLGGEFRVNTSTVNPQHDPSVARDSAGNFIVVWDSFDGSGHAVFAQRYANSGSPLGGQFRVNSFTTSDQRLPFVAADGAGNFVVVWASYGQDGSGYGIFAQRFDGTGSPLGSEFRVNSYTTDDQHVPRVASDSFGHFVVVWTSYDGQDGSFTGIFAQRFSAILPVELQSFRVE